MKIAKYSDLKLHNSQGSIQLKKNGCRKVFDSLQLALYLTL